MLMPVQRSKHRKQHHPDLKRYGLAPGQEG
jgi:hypothetical protein